MRVPDLDDVLTIVGCVEEVRPPDDTLTPSVTYNGFEILVSGLLAPGTLLPLGPRACVISRHDFDRMRSPAPERGTPSQDSPPPPNGGLPLEDPGQG